MRLLNSLMIASLSLTSFSALAKDSKIYDCGNLKSIYGRVDNEFISYQIEIQSDDTLFLITTHGDPSKDTRTTRSEMERIDCDDVSSTYEKMGITATLTKDWDGESIQSLKIENEFNKIADCK